MSQHSHPCLISNISDVIAGGWPSQCHSTTMPYQWMAKPTPSHHHAMPVDGQANANPAPCPASGWPSQSKANTMPCQWMAKPVPSQHHTMPVDGQANTKPSPCHASGWPGQHHALSPLLPPPQLLSEIQVWLVQPGARPLAKVGPFFLLKCSD